MTHRRALASSQAREAAAEAAAAALSAARGFAAARILLLREQEAIGENEKRSSDEAETKHIDRVEAIEGGEGG